MWSYSFNILDNGLYEIEARDQSTGIVLDTASFTIKTHQPEPPIVTSLSDGQVFTSNHITIEGSVFDDTYNKLTSGGTVYMYLNKNETIGSLNYDYITDLDQNGNFLENISLLNGEYQIRIECVDQAGNISFLSDIYHFTVDGSV
jgi:hypothetical protein